MEFSINASSCEAQIKFASKAKRGVSKISKFASLVGGNRRKSRKQVKEVGSKREKGKRKWERGKKG